jgi:YD repeat-containing protein
MQDGPNETDDQIQFRRQCGLHTPLQLEVLESAEVSPDVTFDYDKDGHIVSMELLDAKSQLTANALTQAA